MQVSLAEEVPGAWYTKREKWYTKAPMKIGAGVKLSDNDYQKRSPYGDRSRQHEKNHALLPMIFMLQSC